MYKLSRQYGLYIICLWLLLWSVAVDAAGGRVTLTMSNINLSDAVRLLAGYLKINVIVSPSVQGTTSFHLQNASPDAAFEMLLVTNGLSRWETGGVSLVAKEDELIKRKQAVQKQQALELSNAPLFMHVWQLQYAPVADMVRLINDGKHSMLSLRGQVRADERTNQLYVEDIAEKIKEVEMLLRHMDVPLKQIAVHARIVSIDSDVENELGIDFSVNAGSYEHNNYASGLSSPQAGRFGLAVARLGDLSFLDVKLAALEASGRAELISSPGLFAANQQTASIEAGEEVPYQEVSESGGTGIQFKKAVLLLKVTPQLLPGNRILLHLQINQDRANNKLVQNMPTISTRQMITSVLAKSGQTIVLGGIYENNIENGENRLPFISKIPLIGWLFQLKIHHTSKRELLIFVTPTVVDYE